MLTENTIVKIIKLLGPDNGKKNQHGPVLGDLGIVVKILNNHTTGVRYVVKSLGDDEQINWFREFEPRELRLAPEYLQSELSLTYIRIEEIINDPLDPKYSYFEIGEDDWALRGIFEFSNGALENIGHGIYECPVPRFDEEEDLYGSLGVCDYRAIRISKSEFEDKWNQLMKDSRKPVNAD